MKISLGNVWGSHAFKISSFALAGLVRSDMVLEPGCKELKAEKNLDQDKVYIVLIILILFLKNSI